MKTHDEVLKCEYGKDMNWLIPFPGEWHLLKKFQPAPLKPYFDTGLKHMHAAGYPVASIYSVVVRSFKRTTYVRTRGLGGIISMHDIQVYLVSFKMWKTTYWPSQTSYCLNPNLQKISPSALHLRSYKAHWLPYHLLQKVHHSIWLQLTWNSFQESKRYPFIRRQHMKWLEDCRQQIWDRMISEGEMIPSLFSSSIYNNIRANTVQVCSALKYWTFNGEKL